MSIRSLDEIADELADIRRELGSLGRTSPRRVSKLRDLIIDEISLVDVPANPHAQVVFYKRATPDPSSADAIEQEPNEGGSTVDLMTEMENLARKKALPGETIEQAFARLYRDSSSFRRLVQNAEVEQSELQTARTEKAASRTETELFGPTLTPAEREMAALVDAEHRPGETLAAAFSRVWSDPINFALKRAAMTEREQVNAAQIAQAQT